MSRTAKAEQATAKVTEKVTKTAKRAGAKITDTVAADKASAKVTETVDELALGVWCPRCEAAPESTCVSPSGGLVSKPHYQRRRPILRAYQAGQMNRDDVVIRLPGRNGRKALV